MDKHNGKATASLVLGIIGMIAWLIPLLGFPVTMIGVIMGFFGVNSNRKALGTTGLIFSIISLVLCAVNSALGAYMGSIGQLF